MLCHADVSDIEPPRRDSQLVECRRHRASSTAPSLKRNSKVTVAGGESSQRALALKRWATEEHRVK